jgi:CRP-like cAMP-binding protein
MKNIKANPRLLEQLFRSRFRPPKDVRKLIDDTAKKHRRSAAIGDTHVKGIYKGNYYLIIIPYNQVERSIVPKLPSPQTSSPKPFKRVETAIQQAQESSGEWFHDFWLRLKKWGELNWPVLVLNFGSACSLIGFSRSDVLELRTLSVTGSACSFIYLFATKPIRYTPIVWTAFFATVNSLFIYRILRERNSSVRLTKEQQDLYRSYFLPYGVTPKQFESIYNQAKVVEYKQGTVIIRQGQKMEHVYLVIKGETVASILGRRLSAVSTKPGAPLSSLAEEQPEAAPGAWIGEIEFLEKYWSKDNEAESQEKNRRQALDQPSATKPSQPKAIEKLPERIPPEVNAQHRSTFRPGDVEQASLKLKSQHSLYTIVARDDVTALEWPHDTLKTLIKSSGDMQVAMTRAMTAAIVGKVISFSVSRSKFSWLDDLKYGNVASVAKKFQQVEQYRAAEDLPTYQ